MTGTRTTSMLVLGFSFDYGTSLPFRYANDGPFSDSEDSFDQHRRSDPVPDHQQLRGSISGIET